MIHSTAIIDPSAKVDPSTQIGAYSIIGSKVQIGKNCLIEPHSQICNRVTIGKGNTIGRGSIIGADPQDLSFDPSTLSKVSIGDDNTIRELVTIHRSTESEGITKSNPEHIDLFLESLSNPSHKGICHPSQK